MPSCGLFGVSQYLLQNSAKVGSDRVGRDVLCELFAEDRLVVLIDLDDLFDVALDVTREQVFDHRLGHG